MILPQGTMRDIDNVQMTRFNTDKNLQVFFELLKAGLWEKEVRLAGYGDIDYAAVMKMAEEQSVVGLVTAGFEQVKDVTIPKEWTLQFIGSTLQIEQRNKAMNEFVAKLISLLRKRDIYTLLVKGQGIAQCYEKPLWRASGDVDLFLSDTNYEKAKKELIPLASNVEKEFQLIKHLGMTIDGFSVELHGTLRSRLTNRIDREIDWEQDECFMQGEVRSWIVQSSKGSRVQEVQVFLPGPNQDVIFVFTHILHHLFIEGIGLRQICDWCRLLWTYRDKIDHNQLEKHLKAMGLMSEWKAFASLVVQYLGMPQEAMPMFGSSVQEFNGKASKLMCFVLETGNFGHNRVQAGEGKMKVLLRRTSDAFQMMRIFPIDAWKMYFGMIRTGLILRAE